MSTRRGGVGAGRGEEGLSSVWLGAGRALLREAEKTRVQ